MPKARMRVAFTLIELLVVVAIIALLISILLPSLAGAREQGKRGVCLSNLKSIGNAIGIYSSEDSKEQPIPIHQNMIRSLTSVNSNFWMYRLVNWMAWGGKTPNEAFCMVNRDPASAANAQWLTDVRLRSYWSITRPLNRVLYAGNLPENTGTPNLELIRNEKLDLYRCPSDVGYPDSPFVDDSPQTNANRSCYNTLGNSYRGSLFCFIGADGAFAIGPWGHRLSTLTNTGRLVLIGEPTFFNMIGLDNGTTNPDPINLYGWHKRKMTDNLLFADGSARSTLAAGHRQVESNVANQMGITSSGNQGLISRGPNGWQMDSWPTPGARIWGTGPTWEQPFGTINTPSGAVVPTQWPRQGAQDNLRP